MWLGSSTFYGRSNETNNNENDDDDRDFPIIEELLLAKLQEQGFAAANPNLGHKERGVEKAATDERGGGINRHGLALPYKLSYSIPPCDKTILTNKTISWRIVRGGDFVLDHGLLLISLQLAN